MLPMNERNILKALKDCKTSLIGFADDMMTKVILTDNCFMLITDIVEFKPSGQLMGAINEAKAEILTENKKEFMYNMNQHGVTEKTVEFVKNTFKRLSKLPTENSNPLPFDVTLYDGSKTVCHSLFRLVNDYQYVAFDNRYIELLRNRMLLKDGHLVMFGNTYPLVVDTDVYKFACMPFVEPHSAYLSFLVKN